jgi:hypothetical protein
MEQQINKIIYSLHIMNELVEMGNIPIGIMPNPKNPKYNCWIFEVTDKFKEDLNVVLGGKK